MDLNETEIENMIPQDLQGAIDRLNTVEGKDTMPELNGLDEKWLLSKNRQVICSYDLIFLFQRTFSAFYCMEICQKQR